MLRFQFRILIQCRISLRQKIPFRPQLGKPELRPGELPADVLCKRLSKARPDLFQLSLISLNGRANGYSLHLNSLLLRFQLCKSVNGSIGLTVHLYKIRLTHVAAESILGIRNFAFCLTLLLYQKAKSSCSSGSLLAG